MGIPKRKYPPYLVDETAAKVSNRRDAEPGDL